MSPRFISNLLLLLAGGAVVVSSRWFSAGTTGWIAFGFRSASLGLTGVGARRGRASSRAHSTRPFFRSRLVGHRLRVFRGSTLTSLSFGDALGFVGLGVVGLIAHELSTERICTAAHPRQ